MFLQRFNMTLQLNTRLFLYKKTSNDGRNMLYEVYAIQSGPKIRNEIGWWSPSSGITIYTAGTIK